MVIVDAKNLNHAWTEKEIPGTKYGLSEKGWLTTAVQGFYISTRFSAG